VLVPGQVINETVVEFLVRTLRVNAKVELHGVVFEGYLPAIRVLTAAEQARLSADFARGAGRARPAPRPAAGRRARPKSPVPT
jgi:hypothetical protein